MSKYNVFNMQIQNIIGWIHSGEVAIPEIQRPFVWSSSKVRDLMDSLYKGFPVGYLILWKNPDVKLKDGTVSNGRKILIDGQQRVTALEAAIAGKSILDKNYKRRRIKIAFHPLNEEFEVSNSAIQKNSAWIPDISELFKVGYSQYSYVGQYCEKNNIEGQEDKVASILSKLHSIIGINIGIIELSDTLTIEEVTEIFIRINSQGVVLSQADFAMSKISSDTQYHGDAIRKLIDYFCHFMERPAAYDDIVRNDREFAESSNHRRIKWVVDQNEEIYVPDHSDVLRVSFTHKFQRGRISDLVSLLSGRDFKIKENIESIAQESFYRLRDGVESFVNETNFKRFIMIVRSTGIIDGSLIRSKNVLNFAYILYLSLKEQSVQPQIIERIVRKWIVLSILTGRYSGSPESTFDFDIKKFYSSDPERYLKSIEEGELSDAFWRNVLVARLETSVRHSPYFNVYTMAQVKNNARGFLSEQIEVRSLIEQRGDIHHIFPKKYLQKNGLNNRAVYNQIANYVHTQTEINIQLQDRSPKTYMQQIKDQVYGDKLHYGGIKTETDLLRNLKENCIPKEIFEMEVHDYADFLQIRREMMADYIRDYYESLASS